MAIRAVSVITSPAGAISSLSATAASSFPGTLCASWESESGRSLNRVTSRAEPTSRMTTAAAAVNHIVRGRAMRRSIRAFSSRRSASASSRLSCPRPSPASSSNSSRGINILLSLFISFLFVLQNSKPSDLLIQQNSMPVNLQTFRPANLQTSVLSELQTFNSANLQVIRLSDFPCISSGSSSHSVYTI